MIVKNSIIQKGIGYRGFNPSYETEIVSATAKSTQHYFYKQWPSQGTCKYLNIRILCKWMLESLFGWTYFVTSHKNANWRMQKKNWVQKKVSYFYWKLSIFVFFLDEAFYVSVPDTVKLNSTLFKWRLD